MRKLDIEGSILIRDDEPGVRSHLQMVLVGLGYRVEAAQDDGEVLQRLKQAKVPISVIMLQTKMNQGGLTALREIRRINQDLPVIVISSDSSPWHVVEVITNGATGFLARPIIAEDVQRVIENALEKPEAEPPARNRGQAVSANRAKTACFCDSPQMQDVKFLLAKIGPTDLPVLIQGETGVGKEVIARELHAHSARANKPFVKMNCAALPSELVESELFGYERGAFTGAFQRKLGMFELADGGTLMLDEIGDMDFKLQAKLLQVLQDGEFHRIGGREPVRVDVRIFAATHQNLEKAIVDNRFREDLYYRLNVLNLLIPALREVKGDLMPMMEFLLQKHAVKRAAIPEITPALEGAMLQHDWPGNIRELENFARRFLIFADAELMIQELHTKTRRKPGVSNTPLSVMKTEPDADSSVLEQVTKARQKAETTAILAALDTTHWNRKQAAALLKIDYKAMLYKMKKLGIDEKLILGICLPDGDRCISVQGRSAPMVIRDYLGHAS